MRVVFLVLGLGLRFGVEKYRKAPAKKPLQTAWTHGGVVVKPEQLHGTGRIYLVQMGTHKDPYTVVGMAAWLREEYGLDTQILAASGLDKSGYDSGRKRYVAERVDEQMKRDHAELAADPTAYLIGFTDEPMFSVTKRGFSTISWRDGVRTAVISSDGMKDEFQTYAPMGPNTPESRSKDRLGRVLLKEVAVLFWHLPVNGDAGSVLFSVMDPEYPGHDLYETDLDPMHSGWGMYFGDPCVVMTHRPGMAVKAATPLFTECPLSESAGGAESAWEVGPGVPKAATDTSEERMEVRLAYGFLTEKHTDFYLPGQVPIRLERALMNQYQMPAAFGLSGSHNYDRYLTSRDGMRHISVASAGTVDVGLRRRPMWLNMLNFNTWTDTEYSGRTLLLKWFGGAEEHFELTRYDGAVESYMPCEDSQVCYLNGYNDGRGGTLAFERDGRRNLLSVKAGDGRWLRLSHDGSPEAGILEAGIRVSEIADSQGRRVKYGANAKGQLSSVTYPDGEVMGYEWDHAQNLLSVKAGSMGGPQTTLVTNGYEQGRLVSQRLADGSVYKYEYRAGTDEAVPRWTVVTAPDGTVYEVGFGWYGAFVRVRKHD